LKQHAELIKAAADPTRLGILVLLAEQEEVCVCEMAGALNVPDFKISRHLAVLRSSGLVSSRREGVWMHYRLAAGDGRVEQAVRQLVLAVAEETAIERENNTRCCVVTGEK
jgi:ArsR family transcriptional regulator